MCSDLKSNFLLQKSNAYGKYEERECRFIDKKKQK